MEVREAKSMSDIRHSLQIGKVNTPNGGIIGCLEDIVLVARHSVSCQRLHYPWCQFGTIKG